jgi:hypothetical protein
MSHKGKGRVGGCENGVLAVSVKHLVQTSARDTCYQRAEIAGCRIHCQSDVEDGHAVFGLDGERIRREEQGQGESHRGQNVSGSCKYVGHGRLQVGVSSQNDFSFPGCEVVMADPQHES